MSKNILVHLIPKNNKGFNFIKNHGTYHTGKETKKGLLIKDRGIKMVIKGANDKRLSYEKVNPVIPDYLLNTMIDWSE